MLVFHRPKDGILPLARVRMRVYILYYMCATAIFYLSDIIYIRCVLRYRSAALYNRKRRNLFAENKTQDVFSAQQDNVASARAAADGIGGERRLQSSGSARVKTMASPS